MFRNGDCSCLVVLRCRCGGFDIGYECENTVKGVVKGSWKRKRKVQWKITSVEKQV